MKSGTRSFYLFSSFVAVFLSIMGLVSCKNEDPTDLLASLLDNRSPMAMMNFTHAGSGSTGGQIEADLSLTMAQANRKLYCVFHDVNLPNVLEGLRQAKGRGVDVRVAMDQRAENKAGFQFLRQFLRDTGIDRDLWAGNSNAGVFLNLCVVDDTRVWLSTVAPTVEAITNQTGFSLLLKSRDDGIARKFQTETDLMVRGSMGSAKQRLDRRNFWLISDVNFGIYFSPQENPMDFFMAPRIAQARRSVQIFSSEFFGNERNTSTNCRTTGDLAHSVAVSQAEHRSVYGSWHHYDLEDPDSNNINCSDYATPRGNSFTYLAEEQGIGSKVIAGDWPVGGLQLAIMDGSDGRRIGVINSHPYRRGPYDGFMLVFEHPSMVDKIQRFLHQIDHRSITLENTGQPASALDVVISEINWMGGYRDDFTETSTNYVELYNNTSRPINISGWSVQCRAGGAYNDLFTVPPRTLIGPGQFFVVSPSVSSTTKIVDVSHLELPSADFESANLGGNTTQCRLHDVNSNEIDVAGESGVAFLSDDENAGLSDAVNSVRRSMERTNLDQPGNTLSNWHTNSNRDWTVNHNIAADFLRRTFGTPGYANSSDTPFPPLPPDPRRSLRINELGYRIGAGTPLNNRFIELHNPTDQSVSIDGLYLRRYSTAACDSIGGGDNPTHQVPLPDFTIPAGGYFVMARDGADSNVIPFDFERNDTLNTTNGCYAFTIGNDTITSPTDFSVIDFVAWGDPSVYLGNGAADALANGTAISRCSTTNDNEADFRIDDPTPGAANVCAPPPPALTLPGSTGFESGDAVFVNDTAGIFYSTDCSDSTTIPARNGSGSTGYGDLTTTYTGRRGVSETCIEVTNDDPVTLSVYARGAISGGATDVWARAVLLWYDDDACTTGESSDNGGGTTVTGSYGELTVSASRPSASKRYLRAAFEARRSGGSTTDAQACFDDLSLSN